MNATPGQGGQQGLTGAQHEALDAWAAERGIEIGELQTLKDELSLSASRRAEVFGAAEGAEIIEEKGLIGKTIDFFRKHIGKILIGMGIMGVAAGAYVGKQAIDAAQRTAEEAVDIAIAQVGKEFGEKAAEIQEFAERAYTIAHQLMVQLLNFMGEVQDRLDEFTEVQGAALSLWEGIKEDGMEFWNSRGEERSPDKIMKKVSDMIEEDPVLKARWTAISVLVKQMKKIPTQLGELKDDVLSFDGLPDDFSESTWEKFEENFKDELFHPFQKKYDKPAKSDKPNKPAESKD